MIVGSFTSVIAPMFTAPALCAQVGGDDWFPDNGASANTATTICRRCEARNECLTWALEHDEAYGIWGGLTEKQRRDLTLPAPAVVASDAPASRINKLSPGDRAAIVELTAQGVSASQLAERFNVNPRTVQRVRSQQRTRP